MSLSSWWLQLKTNKKLISSILFGLLIFAAGWQLGKVMSPYYAASPIVFEENGTDSSGSRDELINLLDAGTEQQESGIGNQESGTVMNTNVSETNSGGEQGDVAGSITQGQFVGSVNSNKYHHTSCSTWKQIKAANQIWFADKTEAELAGYVPTKCTAEALGL